MCYTTSARGAPDVLGRLPLYPFFLASLPLFHLYSVNAGVVGLHEIVRPALAAEIAIAVFLGGAWLAMRDAPRAAILTAAAVISMFVYPAVAAVVNLLRGGSPMFVGVPPAVEVPALACCVGLFGVASSSILRTRRSFEVATSSVNLLLGVWAMLMIGRAVAMRPTSAPMAVEPFAAIRTPAAESPHVFYIILDAYGRTDVLRERFGLDNTPFIAALRARGFYVADRSRSNYPQTALSLASSLNAEFVTHLVGTPPSSGDNRRTLTNLVEENRVARFLRDRGYRFAVVSPGASVLELEGDIRLEAPYVLSEFEHGVLALTAIPAAVRLVRLLPGGTALPDQHEFHRRRVQWTLHHLADLSRSDDPMFVLVHVLCPHPPFVFRADGSRPDLETPGRTFFMDGAVSWSRDLYVSGYGEQLAFLNSRLEVAVDRILDGARRPTIIILQGDHGPGSGWVPDDGEATDVHERFGILNAYRFPDGDYRRLYDRITPVNTFRVVLNQYFGTDLPTLEDRSFYATWAEPYRFVEVTDRLSGR